CPCKPDHSTPIYPDPDAPEPWARHPFLPAPRFIHKPALPLCTKKSAGKRPRHTPDGWPPAGERPFRTRPVFILQVFIFSFFRFSFCKGSQTLCTPFHFPVVFP